VPLIVRVDGLNSRQRLSHRRKSEETLTCRDDVAKPVSCATTASQRPR
jgi:hypothetical protein